MHASEKGDFKLDRKIGQSSAGKCGPTKAHWPAPKWSTWDFPIWQKFRTYPKKAKKTCKLMFDGYSENSILP